MSREPIKATCPTIDKYIKYINNEIRHSKDLSNASEDELRQIAGSMNSKLSDCIDYLEELRTSNSILRDWGNEEADKVDELQDKVLALESQIEELEYEKASLQEVLDECLAKEVQS